MFDATTGVPVSSSTIGGKRANTLQMVGTIAPSGTLYQGTITGFVRVTGGSYAASRHPRVPAP